MDIKMVMNVIIQHLIVFCTSAKKHNVTNSCRAKFNRKITRAPKQPYIFVVTNSTLREEMWMLLIPVLTFSWSNITKQKLTVNAAIVLKLNVSICSLYEEGCLRCMGPITSQYFAFLSKLQFRVPQKNIFTQI